MCVFVFFFFVCLIWNFIFPRYLDGNPWNCLDCNVQILGNKAAYKSSRRNDTNYIAYCSNDTLLGDIADAAANFTCTSSQPDTNSVIRYCKPCISPFNASAVSATFKVVNFNQNKGFGAQNITGDFPSNVFELVFSNNDLTSFDGTNLATSSSISKL